MRESQYFRITDDMETGGRRAFATFASEQGSQFAALALTDEGCWTEEAPRLQVSEGWFPDWNLVVGSTVPLVSRRAAEIITRVARPPVQRIAVELPGAEGEWEVLGVQTVDCAEGHPRDLLKALFPVIDPGRTRDCTFFRLPHRTLIARQELYEAFMEHQVTGASFVPASVR